MKAHFTPFKQEKYELSLEWESKPTSNNLIIDISIPFQSFHYKVFAFDQDNCTYLLSLLNMYLMFTEKVLVLDKTSFNESTFITLRDEVAI